MGDLLEKHNTQQQHAKPASKNTIGQPGKGRNATAVSGEKDSHSARRTRKQRYAWHASTAFSDILGIDRSSHEGVYSDKENAPTASPVDGGGLKNPKRRANGARGAGGASSRVVSQQDSRILSPKSLNSKTYPHSPLRGGGGGGGSPDKLQNRHVSPLKPSSPLRPAPADTSTSRARAAKPASGKDNRPASQLRGTGSRAAGNTGPRPATRQNDRRLSTSTTSSVASSGTTIVKSSRPATATGVRKPTVTNTSSGGAGKKTAVARNQAPVAAAAAKKGTASTTTTAGAKGDTSSGRRALRKRA